MKTKPTEAESFRDLLTNLNACDQAKEWAVGKTWEQVYLTCANGGWLLWLFQRTNPDDLQRVTLAKGHCANTVRHLMKDERSTAALDAAIAFGEGKITRYDLDMAALAAMAAARAARAATWAALAEWAAGAAGAAAWAVAWAVAEEENLRKTADICRQFLPIEIWKIN